jgi:hypothetical protein
MLFPGERRGGINATPAKFIEVTGHVDTGVSWGAQPVNTYNVNCATTS